MNDRNKKVRYTSTGVPVDTEPTPIYNDTWKATYVPGFFDPHPPPTADNPPAPSVRFAWTVGGLLGLTCIVLLILTAFGWD